MGLTIDSKLKSTAGGAIMKVGLILKRILFFIVFGTIFSFGAVFSIGDTSANEGSTETFTVTISGPCRQGVTYYVNYATSSGTATSGTDFTAKTGTITYAHAAATVNSGQCGTRTFTVSTTNDAGYEPNETFNVTLSNARSSNNVTYPASIGDSSAIGTILNNDTPPVFSIANVSTTEGNSGTKNLNFTLTLTGTCAASEVYEVNYTTSDGTATAGSDYTVTSNTATFTRATTGTCGTQTISVPIIGETDYESDESFLLTLSNPTNATISPSGIYATGVITNDDTLTSVTTPFSMRYSLNLTGNMKIIGNTVLQAPDNGQSNAEVDLKYTKLASDSSNASIFNSSSATLLDTAITTPAAAKVKWAGLYWSGYLSSSTYTQTQANSLINSHTVKLSIAGGNYIDVSSHTVLGKVLNGSLGISYGCFTDVTNLMQNSDPRGTYRVANIPSTEGRTWDQNDGLGNSGAWTLVVIYENDSIGEKTRNATVFDGFVRVSDGSPQVINVSGFKTPKSGNVDSTLSVFANEGDRYITGDQFVFRNLDGSRINQEATLSSSSGNSNYFNSSITGVDTRTPNLINNNGIDIHTDQLGASGYNIIGTNQTQARMTLGSTGDVYYPAMVSFATELARPNVCYDYAAVLDNQMVPLGSDDLTFDPYISGKELTAKVFIRSLDGDFDIQNTSLTTNLSDVTNPVVVPTATFSYQNAFTQPPKEYYYSLAIPITGKTETVSIGKNNSSTGGILDRQESTYTNMNYIVSNVAKKTIKLNIEVNGKYALDPANPTILTPFKASTADSTLSRCDGNVTYNPRWLNFNIERSGAGPKDYNLYTQVAGLPFDLKIVSYSASNQLITDQTQLTTPLSPSSPVGLEAELFDIPQYSSLSGNQNFSYDRVCEDSSNAKSWKNNERKFIVFPNTASSIPFPVAADENIYAMRSAAVRVWMLLRPDKQTIVHHSCTNTKGTCFKTLYTSNFDTNGYKADGKCGVCTTGTEEACYQCLRRYYGQPICSRDNFAVRPDGIKLTTGDNGVELSNNYKNTPSVIDLASGYDYNVSFKAKNANGTDTQGYYMQGIPTIGDIVYKAFNLMQKMSKFFGVLFDTTTGSGCADTNHTSFDFYATQFKHDNVGKYNLYYVDNDWTLVDHGGYIYKTRPGADCLDGSTAQSTGGNQAGCTTSSVSSSASGSQDYTLLPMRFHPYQYGLNNVNMSKIPSDANRSWVYMNSINNTIEANAANMAVRFIGNIQAQNKDGVVTTNFTSGCAAEDIDLNLSYSSDDFNAALTNPITATSLLSPPSTSSVVGMKYRLQSDGINGDGINGDANNTSSVKFSKTLFNDSGKGVADIDLRYNIEKILDKVVNPLVVLFEKLGALIGLDSNPALRISASRDNNVKLPNGTMTFRPKGVRNYDTNVTFIYARVHTSIEENPVVTTAANVQTRLNILAYCDPLTPASNRQINVNCNNYSRAYSGLNANSPIQNWFVVNTHPGISINNYQNYGVIQRLNLQAGSSARVNPDLNVRFDNNGTTGNVMISHPMSGRTHVAHVTIVPDLWLKYHVDPTRNGNPIFDVTFQQANQNWAGVGVTGNVINKNTTTQNAKDRLSW